MKQLKYFLWVAVLALSVVGCRQTVEVSFDTATQELDAEGGSIELALKSNGDWTINPVEEWLVVSPMSGNGDATLTLTAEANTTGEERSAEIKAVSKDNTASVVVTQQATAEPQYYLTVTPKQYECGDEGGEFVVEVSSNIDWIVTAPNWITRSVTEGTNNATVTLTVNPVDGEFSEMREGKVIFGSLLASDEVCVIQRHDPVLGIDITPNSLEFVCTGETKTVAVVTEDAWTASVEEDWVVLSQTEGQGDAEVTVTVGENPVYEPRQTRVLFTTAGGVQALLDLRQEASPDPHFLEVSPLEFDFGKEGGEQTITIGCDTDWLFDLDCDWLSLSQLSGTGNATLALTAEPNLLTEPRSFVFRIKSRDLFYELTVNQAAGDVPVMVSFGVDTLFVAYTGGLRQVELTSNTSWQLQASSWIGWTVAGSGEGDATFDIIVDSNTDPNDRIGFIQAIHGGQVMATLVVVQEGKYDILETDLTQLDVRSDGGDFVIQVTANQAWTVQEDVNWLHCNPQGGFGNGSFTITVDALTSTRPREGHVTVNGSNGAYIMITVSQHQ